MIRPRGIKTIMQLVEIPWPGAATLMWDGDEILDITTGRRGNFAGPLIGPLINMGYRFDRAIGLRRGGVHWGAAYTNRSTKAVLTKDGFVHRELNRSFYFAEAYDYPITIGADAAGRVVVIHCPNEFDVLEIEDAETGTVLDSLKSKDMEFHSRLHLSADGRLLIDAGWFWHPWCGAVVFEIAQANDGTLRFAKNTVFSTAFSAQHEINSVAFLGSTHLVVSSVSDYLGQEPEPGGLRPKQLGIWSLAERRWESKVDVSEAVGALMPWTSPTANRDRPTWRPFCYCWFQDCDTSLALDGLELAVSRPTCPCGSRSRQNQSGNILSINPYSQ